MPILRDKRWAADVVAEQQNALFYNHFVIIFNLKSKVVIKFKLPACDCEEGPGVFANFLTLGSLLLVVVSLPLSLFFVVKVVQVVSSTLFFLPPTKTLILPPGIREISHLQTGTTSFGWSAGPRCVLHHSLCRYLRED